MDLLIWINGKDYPISYGSGYTDELNETLDSATVIIPHIPEKLNIKPYDDVWVHSKDFPIANVQRFKSEATYNSAKLLGKVYHHYVVGNFSRDHIFLDGEYYTYTLPLVSEAKSLETCPMPNRTITNPKTKIEQVDNTYNGHVSSQPFVSVTFQNPNNLEPINVQVTITSGTGIFTRYMYIPAPSVGAGTLLLYFSGIPSGETLYFTLTYSLPANYKTLWEVCEEYVNSYSPKVRVANQNGTWSWQPKFVLSNALKTDLAFDTTMPPEMQFSSPTLRSALQQLFITKDCLPVLKDGVITYLDITQRRNIIDAAHPIVGASWETYSMDMTSYCDRLRRSYSNALSQNNTCRFVEKMGFRFSGSSTITLENMRLEFTHPIYKIKSFKLCMYNKYTINNGTEKVKLCRYDITPLVLQNSIRNLLSEDWDSLPNNANSFEQMSQYKICTIGYDIGSKYITGWGSKYTYPIGWWKSTRSYIENIMEYALKLNVLSCSDDVLSGGVVSIPNGSVDNMVSPGENPTWIGQSSPVKDLVDDFTQKVKTIFFEVEYEGFVDGTVIVAKDLHDGNIVTNDNTASSLTIVEKDGLFEKEKVNRLGNSAETIKARVKNVTDIRQLGDYTEDDRIIYKISCNFDKDCIDVTYYLCKDWVLKNHYTSVWTKERPFALASYGESVSREENRYVCLLLSKDKCYYQKTSEQILGLNLTYLVSFFDNTNFDGLHYFNDEQINACVVNDYLVDTQVYTVANSLCVSIPMVDNITAGNYIRRIKPSLGGYLRGAINRIDKESTTYKDDNGKDKTIDTYSNAEDSEQALWALTGAVQDWYWISKDTETGYANNIAFSALSINQTTYNNAFKDEPGVEYPYDQSHFYTWSQTTSGVVTNGIFKRLFDMPKNEFNTFDTKLSAIIPYKDGKERINMTMQIDAISDTDDIKISDKFLGMSNLNPNAKKFYVDVEADAKQALMLASSGSSSLTYFDGANYVSRTDYFNIFSMFIPETSNLNNLVGTNLNLTYTGTLLLAGSGAHEETPITYTFGDVISANDEQIVVAVTETSGDGNYFKPTSRSYNLTFKVKPEPASTVLPANEESPMFVPVDLIGYVKYSVSKNDIKIKAGTETIIRNIYRIHDAYGSYFTMGLTKNSTDLSLTGPTLTFAKDYFNFYGLGTTQNIHWYICNKLPKFYVPEEVPTEAVEFTPTSVQVTTDANKPILSILTPQSISSTQSIRCYIDGSFVFGINGSDSAYYKIYLSIMDNRSLSVIDPTTGDKKGNITNYHSSTKVYGNRNDYDIISSGE